MNFIWAIKQCLEHKKVRRPCWEEGHYWTADIGKRLINSVGDNPSINSHQVEAKDWEIYDEYTVRDGRIMEHNNKKYLCIELNEFKERFKLK